MTYEVTVRPQAEVDLAEPQSWYDDQRAGLGAEFRGAIDQLLSRLAENPLMYPMVYKQVHRAVLRHFPYLVYFTASGSSVVVLACLHGKRDPRLVRSRAR